MCGPATVQYLEAWIGSNATAIAKLHLGARHPHARYAQDYTLGYAALLPHLGPLKESVRLLTYHAWLQAESGDFDDAITSLGTSMALTESLTNEPEIVGQLVRRAAHLIVVVHRTDPESKTPERCSAQTLVPPSRRSRIPPTAHPCVCRRDVHWPFLLRCS